MSATEVDRERLDFGHFGRGAVLRPAGGVCAAGVAMSSPAIPANTAILFGVLLGLPSRDPRDRRIKTTTLDRLVRVTGWPKHLVVKTLWTMLGSYSHGASDHGGIATIMLTSSGRVVTVLSDVECAP